MSKEMREEIDKVKKSNQFLNKNLDNKDNIKIKSYKKIYESKELANKQIGKIKEYGGEVKQSIENGKILLEYSFPKLECIIKTIPKEILKLVNDFKRENKIVKTNYNGITIYLYNSKLNKTKTCSVPKLKVIYINTDFFSDIPNLVLGTIGDNIYINVYYAFLHEYYHVVNNHNPSDTDYNKYITSKDEKSSMEFADNWLLTVYKTCI